MRLLELFAGTGSVGRAFADEGWEIISLDINPGHTIKCDIMLWDYKTYPRNHFDCIHASPPCTEYSVAKTVGVRDLEKADAIVSKTLDIIAYYNAPFFIIENPNTGMLKSRPVFAGMGVYKREITYCKYGLPYRKSTAIWTNLNEHWHERRPCCKANPCQHMVDGAHPTTAQQGSCKLRGVRRTHDNYNIRDLYRLPAELCDELARAATTAVRAYLPDSTSESTDE